MQFSHNYDEVNKAHFFLFWNFILGQLSRDLLWKSEGFTESNCQEQPKSQVRF